MSPKKTAKKKSPPKVSRRKRPARAVKRAKKPRVSRVRTLKVWLIKEVMVWSLGVTVGMAIVGAGLWNRALQDVEVWIDSPPVFEAGIIMSGPWTIREGQRVEPSHLVNDLLAAQYQHLPVGATEARSFSSVDGIFSIHSPDGSLHDVRIRDSVVDRIHPGNTVSLEPIQLASIGDANRLRTRTPLANIAPTVGQAVLAMEDSRFRDHHGVDPIGIARALINNLLTDHAMHGGSTLTQQLAKNIFLSADRTYRRKIREVFFAAALESALTKDQLLEIYLSEVYLGQSGGRPIYGVESAARSWFGISADNLSLQQSAAIAGTIASPNRYSPARHPEKSAERQRAVLRRMVSTGDIDQTTADKATGHLTTRASKSQTRQRAPWAVDYALDQAQPYLGSAHFADSGMTITTTIDPVLQRAAEWAVAEGIHELDDTYPKAAGAQMALAVVRVTDGAVVALVGGRNYQDSQFNRAVQAWRSPGSLVKPITVLTAFDEDPELSPNSTILDEPISRTVGGKVWSPKNYDGQYQGLVTLRQVLQSSLNVPSVILAERIGAVRLKRQLIQMGVSRADALPSASLGAFEATVLEMAGVYAVFPNGGIFQKPTILQAIHAPSSEPLFTAKHTKHRVASERATALTTSILKGVIANGTGKRAAQYGARGSIGGKTGTTDDFRDAWFAGFTAEYAVAVWVGRDKSGNLGLSGSRAALPTWSRFIRATGTMKRALPRPDSVTTISICTDSLQPARPECDSVFPELVSSAHIPPPNCDHHGSLFDTIPEGIGGFFGWGRGSR